MAALEGGQESGVPAPLKLLMLQGFLQGGAAALFVAAANTMFLIDHGSARLPWVYICAAVAIPLVSFGFNSFAERTSAGTLTVATVSSIALIFFGAWALVVTTDATWVSFALMVLFFFLASYIVMIQNVQASLFFDVREMKQKAPPMMATAMIGMVLFGFLTPLLLRLFDTVAHLLLVAGFLVVLMALAARVLVQQHPEAFATAAARDRVQTERSSLRRLWQDRYIRTVFGYQFLSSLGTRLILFLFLVFAARKFDDASSLASFIAGFNATTRIVTVVVLLAVVRPLLQRIGLSFGLLSNPVMVMGIVAVMLVAVFADFDSLTVVFWVVVVARGLDLVFTFSSTEASVRTIYQVFPGRQRVAAITTIEGFSIPLSIGIAGVSLLILDVIDAGEKVLVSYIAVVCLLWFWASRRAVSGYGSTLSDRLRTRGIDPVQLSIDDDDTARAVIGLVQSDDPSTVGFALDLLERERKATYLDALPGLLDREPAIAIDAAERLRREPNQAAAESLRAAFQRRTEPGVRGALLGALVAVEPEEFLAEAEALLQADAAPVRRSALVSLLRSAPRSPMAVAADAELDALVAGAPQDQMCAADLIGQIGHPDPLRLRRLLTIDHPEVRRAALHAAARAPASDLVPLLVTFLGDPSARSAAHDALVALGDACLETCAGQLKQDHPAATAETLRLVGVLRAINSSEAQRLLLGCMGHDDPAVRRRVLDALRAMRCQAVGVERDQVLARLEVEIAGAVTYREQRQLLGSHPAYAGLDRALGEQIDETLSNAFALFGLLQDADTIARAHGELSRGGARRSLAIETVENLLSANERMMFRQLVAEATPVETPDPGQVVRATVAENPSDWCRAVALASIGGSGDRELLPVLREGEANDRPFARECRRWAQVRLGEAESETTSMLIVEKVALLKQASIFASSPDAVMAAVASIADEVYLGAGERLLNRGDPAHDFYVLAKGELAASIDGTMLATIGPGEIVGELGIFNDEPRAADVDAISDVMLFSIQRGELAELMADRPEIAQGIIGALSRRLTTQGLLIVASPETIDLTDTADATLS